MDLKVQKRLAAQVLKCSPKRIVFDPERLGDIKEAITKADIKGLISDRAVICLPKKGVSRVRAKERRFKKSKGQRRGFGKRKGTRKARLSKKLAWMNKVRSQRTFIRLLRDKNYIERRVARELYLKAKSGFFRSMRHINLYLTERGLVKKK
ncbi:MAG: 50S ribosomal protein L19e [Candidatus Woesearchaeota archaeon]